MNITFHKNKKGSIIRSTGTVFYSLLYLNSRRGFNGLQYMYSVISVIVESLPGNTKNRESTRSWTARVRLVHPWGDCSSVKHQRTHDCRSVNHQSVVSVMCCFNHVLFDQSVVWSKCWFMFHCSVVWCFTLKHQSVL